MPVVFVHGVSNRAGPEYNRRLAQRIEFLRAIVLPALGLDPASVQFFDPYWGDEGVKFRWQNASLPELGKEYETFGAAHDETELVLVAQLPELARHAKGDIVAIARKSLPEAIELLWAVAMASADRNEVHAALAKTYALVAGYAEREKSPAWLAQAVPGNFVEQLIKKAKTSATDTGELIPGHPAYESFGLSEFLEDLGEAASRIGNVLGDLSGEVATSLGRRGAHMASSVFIGDAFQYLTRRGDRNQPGLIPKIVINAFRDARAACSVDDPKLIVIGHSLGGVISYDVLTHFAVNLEVDVFVCVGSQVGLFEEMTLYKESRIGVPLNPPTDRLARPANVKRWLNIFDTTDIFGFRAESVFDGAHDFFYDTGYGLFSAHGGYFERPSFYRRLATRLKEADS
jgi:hypothetical protein